MKKHILIVDDEAAIRDLLAQYLTVGAYQVTTVSSAVEALAAIRLAPPDLIISDLQLEDSDGLEMIGQLKAVIPEIPVILLTGVLFDPEVVRDTLSKKVACYLEKTAPLKRILQEVERLVGH
ncbi:MAG: response regulator [Opitutus sp.]|nr:response regulator [Opitutus sp.]